MQNRRGRSQCSQDHPEILELRQESGLNVGTVHDSAGFLLDERTNDGKADLFFFPSNIYFDRCHVRSPLSLSRIRMCSGAAIGKGNGIKNLSYLTRVKSTW